MLDRKFIVENPGLVKQNCAQRGAKVDVDKLVDQEKHRRELAQRVQELNTKANQVSASIGKAKDAAEREARKEEGRKLRDEKDQAQKHHDALDAEIAALARMIPNLTHPHAPIGGEDAAREVKLGKSPKPKFDFKPLDHVVLGEKLNMLDFEGGASVAGHGFYFLKNDAVLLEMALTRYALDLLIAEGFTPTITPDLARNEILEGIGFIPRGTETQIYSVENTDLSLVATAEITLGGMLSGKVLDEDELPIKIAGISHCFRTEAGAHGKATRGLYRVHQFTKVEMFAFTAGDVAVSDAMLDHLCDLECRIFDGLGIHYRVIDTPSGDLGGPAYRKFDLEAWMPGRGDAGEYGEVTSTSNCTDYQSRRLDIRYKKKGEKGTHLVHTLNGTAVAISRGLIAVMENYQQADGSIAVPKVLQAFMGKERIG
jgi:seryl-tRNA synthetase